MTYFGPTQFKSAASPARGHCSRTGLIVCRFTVLDRSRGEEALTNGLDIGCTVGVAMVYGWVVKISFVVQEAKLARVTSYM